MPSMAGWITETICFGIAFSMGLVAIYLDCYQAVRKIIWSVPAQFFKSFAVFSLASGCGALAGLAYLCTDPKGEGYVSKLLTLSIENPYGRAANVGMLVLVLIRSRLFQFQGTDIGGEFFYSEARVRAIKAVILRWSQFREQFLSRHLDRTFAVPDYADKVLDRLSLVMQGADDDYRRSIESQIAAIRNDAPKTPANPDDPLWRTYHRAVTGLALTNCGAKALEDFGMN